MNKQIEEMARICCFLCEFEHRGECENDDAGCKIGECFMAKHTAEKLYNAGYRKQREGEWVKQKPDPEAMKTFHKMGLGNGMSINSIYWTCSVCGNWGTPQHKYCSSCGAKMKGGAE